MSKIIQNAIKTHDGVILCSTYTHDFVTHGDYSLDGGKEYIKISYPVDHKDDFEGLFIYEEDSIEVIKSKLVWGTVDKNNKIKYVKLYDCTIEHLQNILKHGILNKLYKETILYIIDEKLKQLRYKKIMKLKNV